MILKHLAQAERHVAEGAVHVERQKQIVLELERDGHDSRQSRELLKTFEETQTLHVADRERLRRELAEAG